jgi:hypothetical protein
VKFALEIEFRFESHTGISPVFRPGERRLRSADFFAPFADGGRYYSLRWLGEARMNSTSSLGQERRQQNDTQPLEFRGC